MWTELLSSAGNAYAQHRQNEIAFNKNQKSNENAFWLNFWAQNYFMDKQNAYNHPKKQMERLNEAGLNPNLVYEKGATTLSASPSGGGMQGSNYPNSRYSIDYLEKKAMVQSMKQQEANIMRTNADISAINNNIEVARANLALNKAETNARIRHINAETDWLNDRVDPKNPNTWSKLNTSWTDLINPIKQAEKIGSVYNNLYNNVYGLMEAKFGRRKRR